MKPTILLLLLPIAAFAQTDIITLRETHNGYQGTIQRTMPLQPPATSSRQSIAAGVAQEYGIPARYNYDELDSRYPVREVVPRNMLTPRDQRQLEEDDIRLRQAKINEDRSMLDLERDKIALKTIDATQEQERIGLEKLRQLQPGSETFESDVASIINELPFAASGKAFNEAMNVLNTAHTRKLQSADIIERGRIAREESQLGGLRSAAYDVASSVGPDAVSAIANIDDPKEQLRIATAKKNEQQNAMIRTQLRNAGLNEKNYETGGFFDAQSALADLENAKLGTKQIGQLRDDRMQLLRYRNSILADIGKTTDDTVKTQLQTDLKMADDELRLINDQMRKMNPASVPAETSEAAQAKPDLSQYEGKMIVQNGQKFRVTNGVPVPIK